MVAIELAPVKSRDQWVRSITTPTGSYYMVGCPSRELAEELVSMGIERVVFVASEQAEDWESVEKYLQGAGVEISATWNT